jgi:hypothetical protein
MVVSSVGQWDNDLLTDIITQKWARYTPLTLKHSNSVMSKKTSRARARVARATKAPTYCQVSKRVFILIYNYTGMMGKVSLKGYEGGSLRLGGDLLGMVTKEHHGFSSGLDR